MALLNCHKPQFLKISCISNLVCDNQLHDIHPTLPRDKPEFSTYIAEDKFSREVRDHERLSEVLYQWRVG